MATARCVSEIHVFAVDEELFRFSSVDGSLTLRIQVGFLAKNELSNKASVSSTIPRPSNICQSHNFNRLLYPIRAIKSTCISKGQNL